MVCILKLVCTLLSLWFLYIVHPLWLSLMVFLVSISMALLKFFSVFEFGMFSYLFVMVYSGGLLLLLVYMSALVPNSNLSGNIIFSLLIFSSILFFSMYMVKENFNQSQNSMFFFQKSLGMNYFITYKDLMYSLIWILLLSFSLISLLMSLLKYPMRSL
uniref:NADH dehydrogenase subunit 6 n=1 Tax=Trichuris trichiura TaxID=36087 RepID=A0A0M4R6N3_TRITR|nr:NADH dehydrogenase subunit 6 [Trichuris trichiura]